MHFYKFHINDYAVQTRHLTNEHDLCLRRLLDFYYTHEAPIPLETERVARRIQIGSDIVEEVLTDFFIRTPEGWINNRADAEIAEYHAICERARANGKRGGRPSTTQQKPSRNPAGTEQKPSRKLSLIINQDTPIVPSGDLELVPVDESEPETTAEPYSPDFLTFWASFPEKKGKGAAWRTWERIKGRPPVGLLTEAIRQQQLDRAEARRRNEFYPEWKNPATWLHGACWEDGLKYTAVKPDRPSAPSAPPEWREILLDEYAENYPDGLESSNFPSGFHLLPQSVQEEIRAAACLRQEIAGAIRNVNGGKEAA